MNAEKKTRKFELEIDLKQTPARVWRALSEAEELARWFPMSAAVEPRVGGRYRLDWKEPWKFAHEIEAWEPGKRLRLLDAKTDQAGNPVTHVIDFQLENHAGGTRLRLVHSGFSQDAEWDEEFDGISRGWDFELYLLRHYLDHHDGKDRAYALIIQDTGLDQEEMARRMFSGDVLRFTKPLAGAKRGDAYGLQSLFGEDFSGRVVTNRLAADFAGVVDNLDRGIFRYETYSGNIFFALMTWGKNLAGKPKEFESRWQPKLAEIFR